MSKEALYTPEDAVAPITLLFDTTTWTPIDPVPVSRFRGLRVLKRGPTEHPKDTSWNDKERSSKEHLK